jgi:cell division septation protein DedD
VGCFSSKANADNLAARLAAKGYSAYVEEAASPRKATYRVRVGRLTVRQEAVQIERKLASEGYPTKIFP